MLHFQKVACAFNQIITANQKHQDLIYNMFLCLSVKSVKVYVPEIEGHVPEAMVQAMHVSLEFCYIA